MLTFIDNLTLLQIILIFLAILVVNLGFIFLVRIHIETLYKKTNSIEQAMDRLRVLSQYLYMVVIVISSFSIAFLLMMKLVDALGDSTFTFILSIVSSFIFLGAMITINQLVIAKTAKKIRDTEATMKEETSDTIRGLLFIFVPITLVLTVMQLIPDNFLNGAGTFIFPIIIIVLIPLATAPFTGKMLKATAMPESAVKQELVQFLTSLNIENVQLYVWPTKKKKMANALVTGFTKKKQIYIADYMLENMTMEEVKSVLAHEIGHIKKRHLWKRLGLLISIFVLISGFGYGMEWYETHVGTISIWLGVAIILGLLLFGFAVVFRYFSRVHEREADAYVLYVNIDYRDYAGALMKLATLNHSLTKMNKLDESFQTHPSIARRIHWIIEQANGSIEEVQAYLE
ncbi:protease HtpX [Paraliobacillus ryukyuensis]|uniref:STE24 endopeptidase n=1 Tax=Paraliobacillus ryukyuensis TaxID=200904 RepID=A0A366E6J5_9BACI|nr:M48 family metallopeptidase [Paraliobacillus ryukyuensis]RBO97114.1 STE24 endopeptidase [Paraliobacillus ryukyuensis]